MATLAAVKCVSSGIDLTDTSNAAAGGDEFVNTGKEKLLVRNDGADPRTVTIPRTRKIDGQSAADLVVTVAAGGTQLIGPFRAADYNDEDDKVQVAYDEVTEDTPAPDTQTVFVLLIQG